MKQRLLVLLVLAGVGWSGWWLWQRPRWPIVNWPKKIDTIVAYGDSLTRGRGGKRDKDYPTHLGISLGRKVINAGKDGDKTSDGLARLEQCLKHRPDMVLLCLGGNDILASRPADEAFANLEQIIDRIQQTNAVVMLIEVRDLRPLSPYSGRFEELARRKGCIFVPNALKGIIGKRELMADQIHPNSAGYGKLARRIEKIISRYIE
jgi:acyl-CoA thioesterase-1